MGTEATLEQQREQLMAQALDRPNVAAGMAVFAAASRLSPAPRLIMTSQVVYSTSANR